MSFPLTEEEIQRERERDSERSIIQIQSNQSLKLKARIEHLHVLLAIFTPGEKALLAQPCLQQCRC